MIPWLNVKGTWKQPSSIWGKANGVWQSLGGAGELLESIDYYDLFMPTATPSAGYGVVSKLVKLEAGDVITFIQTGSDSTFRNEFSLYTGDVQEGGYPAHYYENLTAVWSNLGFTGIATVTIEQDGLYCFNSYYGSAFDSIMVTKTITLEPYNEALRLVGLSKVNSLDAILADSEMCNALAGNAEACNIMKSNYTVDMTFAIDSTLWNEGLNLLNYKCTLKCYLYHSGNTCDAITNGWAVYPTDGEKAFNSDHIKIAGYSECTVHTGQQIDMTGYKKLVSHQTGYQWVTGYGYAAAHVKFGHGQSRVNHEYNVSQGANTPQGRNDGDHPIHKATLIVDAKQGSAFVKGTAWGAVVNDMSPKSAMYIYNVYLEP